MILSSDVLAKIGSGHPQQPQNAAGPLLTRSELAALLNVSVLTVRSWELAGKLPPAEKTPKGWSLYSWPLIRTVLREALSHGWFAPLSRCEKRGPALGTIPQRAAKAAAK